MKKLLIPLLLVLLAVPVASNAQTGRDCGNGLPCGAIPWQRLNLPELSSPTPMPTFNFSATPPPTPIPTSTPGPSPTPGASPIPPTATAGPPTFDVSDLEEAVDTLQALNNATPLVVVDANGTPVAQTDQIYKVGLDAGTFFGFARSVLNPNTFGSMWPLVAFSFTALAIVLIVTVSTFFVPMIVAIIGLIRTIVDFVRKLIGP